MTAISKTLQSINWIFKLIGQAAYRFYWDDCFSRAAALAYTTLLSLVPVTGLSISVFSIFGIRGEQVGFALKSFLSQLLPSVENVLIEHMHKEVLYYLETLGRSATALNTLSLAFLVFIGIALLNTVESALNAIWRVSSATSIVGKITNFWAVITLGPALLALSIYWNTRVYQTLSHEEALSPFFTSQIFTVVEFFIPVAVSAVALGLLFYRLPAAVVRLKDAAFGAFIASILFEFAKRGFAYYLTASSNNGSTFYSTLYASLALIPLFLFWLYITWVIILFGAELAYQAGSVRVLSGRKKYATDLGDTGAILGLRILTHVGRHFVEGKPLPSEGEIAIESGSDPVLVRTCLDILTNAGILSASDQDTHRRTLLRAPENVFFSDIVRAFHSKKHQRHLEKEQNETTDQGQSFLELIRKTSLSSGLYKDTNLWTLADMIQVAKSQV